MVEVDPILTDAEFAKPLPLRGEVLGIGGALSRCWAPVTWKDRWGEHRNGVVQGPPLVRHERGMGVWM
jgi:hypothetical protein